MKYYIFFATFEYQNGKSDRIAKAKVHERESKIDIFYNWVKSERGKIEKKQKTDVMITSINII